MKFIIIVWLEFLTRIRPVSTKAKPACMNMTRYPHTRVQTKLMAILFWPIWLAMSPIVSPFALGVLSVMGSATVMSDTLPVRPPSGSPLERAFVSGDGIPLRSASVIGTGAGAGAAARAAGGLAGGVCATANGARLQIKVHASEAVGLFMEFIFRLPCSGKRD